MKNKAYLFLFLFFSGIACRKEQTNSITATQTVPELTAEQAKKWFQAQYPQAQGGKNGKDFQSLQVPWVKFTSVSVSGKTYGLVALDGQPKFNGFENGYRKLLIEKNAGDTLSAYLLEILPDPLYLQSKQKANRADFYGRIFFYNKDYELVKGFIYANGKVIGQIKPQKNKTASRAIKVNLAHVIESCIWNDANYINANGEVVIYSERTCSYEYIGDGYFGGDNGSPADPAPPGGDYTGNGGGGGGSSSEAAPVSDLPGENNPGIDPKKYMKCFSNLPDAGSKMTVTVYVQEPAPGLPFNIGPNSVGHTAIGLTKTYNGQSITQVVGFYPDATGKDKMHAPSKVSDNSGLNYNVSITYSLIASQFNKVINYLSNPPSTYDLTSFNCTNFVWSACQAGGINLPDPVGNMGLMQNGMTPAALGGSIRNVDDAGNTNLNGGVVENTHGSCN